MFSRVATVNGNAQKSKGCEMSLIVYLTGAPATGKSTLARNLAKAVPELRVFSYSSELRDYVARRAGIPALSEEDIRQESAKIVTKEDVIAVDEMLIDLVAQQRKSSHSIVIDSHAVTKEHFGFRVTPFSLTALKLLAPDVILCLYLDSQIARARIRGNPMGRPLPSQTELELHCQLQAYVAVQYGIILGRPVYMLDSSVTEDELLTRALERLKLAKT